MLSRLLPSDFYDTTVGCLPVTSERDKLDSEIARSITFACIEAKDKILIICADIAMEMSVSRKRRIRHKNG
jgi:hypothetical protein